MTYTILPKLANGVPPGGGLRGLESSSMAGRPRRSPAPAAPPPGSVGASPGRIWDIFILGGNLFGAMAARLAARPAGIGGPLRGGPRLTAAMAEVAALISGGWFAVPLGRRERRAGGIGVAGLEVRLKPAWIELNVGGELAAPGERASCCRMHDADVS